MGLQNLKKNANNDINRDKAYLVVKGFAQTKRVDYFETFVLVVKFASIKSMLALITISNFEIHQMDVKSALLNGDLIENMYMKQLEGYEVALKTNLVCKFKKSIYGLKQAQHVWNTKINSTSKKSALKGAHQTKVCISLEMRKIYKYFQHCMLMIYSS